MNTIYKEFNNSMSRIKDNFMLSFLSINFINQKPFLTDVILGVDFNENYISKEQYDSYLAQRQYVTGVISKDRYCIVDNNTYYELDVYPFWNDRATIEIELLSEDQRYQLPKFVKLIREVSSEPDYRNLALAQKYGKP